MSTSEQKRTKKASLKTNSRNVTSKETQSPKGTRKDRQPISADATAENRKKSTAAKLSAKERRELAEATLKEYRDNGAAASEVSVIDRKARMLLERGIVTSDQVREALARGGDSDNLWRMIVDVDGVETGAVYAAIANNAGIREFLYLDAAPSREFIDDLITSIGRDSLLSLLDRDLLPVEQEPGLEAAPLRLTIATHDPTHPNLGEFFGTFSCKVECCYASESALIERLKTVRGWITEQSRYGTAPVSAELDPASIPQSEDGAGDVLDLGSYGVDGALAIERPPSNRSANGPDAVPARDPVTGHASDKSNGKESTKNKSEGGRVADAPSPGSTKGASTPVVNDRVLDWLLRKKIVTIELVREAVSRTKGEVSKDAAWRYLAEMKEVAKEEVYREVADLYAFKHVAIEENSPDHDFVLLTMETIAETRREALIDAMLIPLEHVVDSETGVGRMIFATHDPTRADINVLLHQLDLGRFELRYAPESAIAKLLLELFPKRNEYLDKLTSESSAFDLGTSHDEGNFAMVDEEALEAEMSRSNLINLFEASLVEAVRQGASDIHIFPNAKRQVEIHFRRDGRLKNWHTEDSIHPEAFLAVVKDNSSGVDRFERDSAQDGFIQRIIDDTLIRFRVSILPIASANVTIRAESIVIRILDDRKVLTDLGALGMLDVARERFDRAIRQPHGMVILTGPTGSGKSTTLVASLYQVITPEVNVLSVEDPVEYIIRGVRQIKLSHKLDLDSALRSILRHDPDIVMVGEMRDKHTADLAIKLSNTGHLTFSTLHTNDAAAAISRLYKMGVEPFLIAYAINLIVAQRLVRTVCPECRTIDKNPDKVLMRSLGWSKSDISDMTIFKANRGSGCTTCNSVGYKGRRALCETLYFSERIRHMIAASDEMVDEDAIKKVAIEEGMLTLQDSARVLVAMGETTVEEMLRVTGSV